MSAIYAWWSSTSHSTRQMILVASFALSAAAALAGLIMASRGPQISILMTPYATQVQINGQAPKIRNAELALVSQNHTRRDLAIGGDVQHLAETLKKLRGLTTSQREAMQSNHMLHVAIVDIPTRPENLPGAPQIGVNIKDAGGAAVLLIAREPVVWRIDNAAADQRGKIAVESPMAFDIDKATPGLISDFRSAAFGDRTPLDPRGSFRRDLASESPSICAALIRWATYYGLNAWDIGVWTFDNPAAINVRESGLSTSDWMQARASDLELKCWGHPAARNGRYYSPSYNQGGAPLTGKSWR
jgi:hypothetical protein